MHNKRCDLLFFFFHVQVITLREGSRPRPPTRIHLHAVGVQSAQLKIFGPPKEQLVGYRIQFVKNIPSMSINNGDYQDVFVSK